MQRLVWGSLAALSLLVVTNGNALAKDICLLDNFGSPYVFKKVARLRPGGAIPLTGFRVGSSTNDSLDGSTALNAAGTEASFGIFVHSLATNVLATNFTAEWTGDTTFAGTGAFDNDGDFSSNGTISFSAIDCKTVAIP